MILISVDTLRADHVGIYGYPKPTSPEIDAFAERAVIFERAYTQASHTLPAHASLLTGLYPETHAVLLPTDSLSTEVPTLAEMLAGAGYETAAFVNASFLDPKFGLDRGFDRYDFVDDLDPHQVGLRIRFGRDADETDQAVLAWLRKRPERPFFLFVHYFDVHSDFDVLPYEAPPEYRSRFAPDLPANFPFGDGEVFASRYLWRMNRRGIRYSEPERDLARSLYDAGIAYVDDRVGDLLEELEKAGLLQEATVFLVSDHGEEFQEHGKVLHEQVFEELVRVPLVISFPEGRFAGRRVGQPVETIDVVPTILALVGVEPRGPLQGRSLLSLLEGGGSRDAPVFSRNQEGSQYAVTERRWKLVERLDARDTLLFDLERDPQEQEDRSQEDPAVAVRLKAALDDWKRNALRMRPALAPARPVSEGLRRSLEALGYTADPGD